MAGEISEASVRFTLDAVREVSGPQYAYLLKEAGLERFLTPIPPGDKRASTTMDEMTGLYQTVYRLLGEHVTRLFFRHLGQRLAPVLLASPGGQAFRRQVQALPPEQRLGWFIESWAAESRSSWGPVTLTEAAEGWYYSPDHCTACVGVHGARAPLCGTNEVVLREVIKGVVGQAVQVTEIECVAMGADHCIFAIMRP